MPLQEQAPIPEGFEIRSRAMKDVYEEVADFAFHHRSCILFGPSGAGKEYVSRHYYSVFRNNCGRPDPPPFLRLNCVGIPETLAMSELFGIEGGTATGVKAKKGLFQEAENGVLFLDEVGDLPPQLEAMLLRAVDTEIHEARRLGASEPYSTELVTVICATEQPPSDVRRSLLDRFENQVFVPGLDERPEDLQPAIRYFTLKAFLKRLDLTEVLRSLYGIEKQTGLHACAELQKLADDLAEQLVPLARTQTWEGSFRVLRSAVDYAVLRAKADAGSQERFIEQAQAFFKNKGMRQTAGAKKTEAAQAPSRTVCSDAYDEGLYSAIAAALPHADGPETQNIARFLSRRDGVFKIKDFEPVLPGLSRRTAQDRLKALADAGIIARTGQYCRRAEKQEAAPAPSLKAPSFLPLPEDAGDLPDRRHDLDGLHDLLDRARAVYISGARGCGKTACAKALGYELKTQQNRAVYYYSFDERGAGPLLGLIDRELANRGIAAGASVLPAADAGRPALAAAILSGYVHMLCSSDVRPVLILDNADLVSQAAQTEALQAMLQYWQALSFVLVGKKLGNELRDEKGHELVEYQITAQPAG